jgi:ATP adenylyltransferase
MSKGTAFAIYDKFPVSNGHVLIIPKRHCSNYFELSDIEQQDCFRLLSEIRLHLQKTFSPDGFNIGINIGKVAGAGMEEHMHLHMVPRWAGDTSFMTVFDEVRVIPEHVMSTYDKLFAAFQS